MNNENNPAPLNESELTHASVAKRKKIFPSTLSSTSSIGLVIALIIFLVLVVLGFMASSSLPGEPLYAMKTQVLERLDAAVQFGSKNKAANQVQNMETRLAETKALSEKGEVDQRSLDALHERSLDHLNVLTQLVQQESADFSMEDRLFTLNSFASVAGAMEEIAENDPELLSLGDQMEDVRRESVKLYKDTADTFAQSSSPDIVLEFIKNSLGEVSAKLGNANLGEKAIDNAEEYIYRVAIAIKDKNYTKAIYSVGEAFRFIRIDEYTGPITPLVRTATEPAASSTPSETATSTASSSASTTTVPL